ncbi:MAG TPA: protein TolQ [Rickettsiales bacterium]|nr:protein TolQ [Rickettsiales bacterium]
MVNTAVDPVQATDIANGVAVPVAHKMSFLGMFMSAEPVVQIVMLMLLLASFWAWATIFDKWLTFRTINAKATKFETDFWASEALDKFYERVKKKANHPMGVIFVAAMDEWFRSRIRDIAAANLAQKLGVRERIHQVMMVARNREIEKLENGLGFLATIGSSAPFIGLFGTVLGIMHSFTSIAVAKNTSLVSVAPGIAEALFATAIGLFAAIPAVIAYNKFSGELEKFSGKLEDFSVEFNLLMSRQIEG